MAGRALTAAACSGEGPAHWHGPHPTQLWALFPPLSSPPSLGWVLPGSGALARSSIDPRAPPYVPDEGGNRSHSVDVVQDLIVQLSDAAKRVKWPPCGCIAFPRG